MADQKFYRNFRGIFVLRILLFVVVGIAVATEVIAYRSAVRSSGVESVLEVMAYASTDDSGDASIDQPTEKWFRDLFLSRHVLDKALTNANLRRFESTNTESDEFRKLLERSIAFESTEIPKGVTMTVRLSAEDPAMGKALLNALFDSFVEFIEDGQRSPVSRQLEQIDRLIKDKVRPDLEDAERQYAKLRASAQVDSGVEPTQEEKDQLQQVERLRKQLEDLTANLHELSATPEPSRIEFQVLSDGVESRPVSSSDGNVLTMILRLVAILFAIVYGVIRSVKRRRSRQISNVK